MSAAKMREALKPCPFCGELDVRLFKGPFGAAAKCTGCGVSSVRASLWNRRALPLPDEEGMVERVARALAAYQFSREDYWEDQVDMALFVIRAINKGEP